MHDTIAVFTPLAENAVRLTCECIIVQVWDVARAVDRPRLAHSVPDNIALTHVTFAPGLLLLVCGHSNGLLTVLRHHDIGLEQDLTVEEQRARLASALHTSNTVPGA